MSKSKSVSDLMSDKDIQPFSHVNFVSLRHGIPSELPVFVCGFGERFVDETNWRPDSDIVRNHLLGAGVSSGVPVFDFPDGKDSGFRPMRDIGADITEIDAEIDRIKSDGVKTEQQKAQRREQIEALSEAMQSALGIESESASVES